MSAAPVAPAGSVRNAALTLFALLALTPSAVAGAQSLTSVSVSASMRLPMFATTAPVLEAVRFGAPSNAESRGAWGYAMNSTVLSSDANVPHVVTVVALSSCGDPGVPTEDDDTAGEVQWSSDGGQSWHPLAFSPSVVGPRETAGRHVGAHTIRYRRRFAAGGACVMRVAYTAIPTR